MEIKKKLEIFNDMMPNDRQRRQAQYITTSGYSEDSDYTSDFNYPVGQNANSSASHYRNLKTPSQRSLANSRENSYEKDDRCNDNFDSFSTSFHNENEPLFYNSRPKK